MTKGLTASDFKVGKRGRKEKHYHNQNNLYFTLREFDN